MPDIRYHFVYLIAIFLMLGLGILAGASWIGQDQVRRQTKAIAALRDQVNGAEEAKDELAKYEAALDALRPSIVHSKLTGRRVVLIQTGDYSDATDSAASALRDAGASPVATVKLSTARWLSMGPDDRAAIVAEFAQSADVPVAESDPAQDPGNTPIMAALAALLVQGEQGSSRNEAARVALENAGLITVTGDLSVPSTDFVLVGGSKDESGTDIVDQIDVPLLAQLKSVSDESVSIVGCEPFDAYVSYMRSYQGVGVATVDCIDRPLGQLDLPYALLGGPDTDNYGLKPTASRQIPSSLDGQPPL